jgi:hypothetical protein
MEDILLFNFKDIIVNFGLGARLNAAKYVLLFVLLDFYIRSTYELGYFLVDFTFGAQFFRCQTSRRAKEDRANYQVSVKLARIFHCPAPNVNLCFWNTTTTRGWTGFFY